jgi:hypothetical protein
MSSKKYRCPYCEQTSSRRWNLMVHSERRHQGVGEPFDQSQTGSTYHDKPHYRNEPREELSARSNRNEFSSYSRSHGRGENIDRMRNSLDDTVKNLRRIAEIQWLTRELNSQYNPLQLPSISQTPNSYPEQFRQILGSFKLENDPLRDHIIGLRCHICETCWSTVPLPIYGFKKSGKIIPSVHDCNLLGVVNSQGLSSLDGRSNVTELYKSSIQTMRKAIQDCWLGELRPHLILVPLISAEEHTFKFTPELLNKYQWLSKAIEEGEITLNDSYLEEFMSFTRGNTFIKFSMTGAKTILPDYGYFMTLSKQPSLPFDFTLDNP